MDVVAADRRFAVHRVSHRLAICRLEALELLAEPPAVAAQAAAVLGPGTPRRHSPGRPAAAGRSWWTSGWTIELLLRMVVDRRHQLLADALLMADGDQLEHGACAPAPAPRRRSCRRSPAADARDPRRGRSRCPRGKSGSRFWIRTFRLSWTQRRISGARSRSCFFLRLVQPRRPAARRLAHQDDANAAVLGRGRQPADAA